MTLAEDYKAIIRGYFVEFLKNHGKGVSSENFELLSQFENYIVKRLNGEK